MFVHTSSDVLSHRLEVEHVVKRRDRTAASGCVIESLPYLDEGFRPKQR